MNIKLKDTFQATAGTNDHRWTIRTTDHQSRQGQEADRRHYELRRNITDKEDRKMTKSSGRRHPAVDRQGLGEGENCMFGATLKLVFAGMQYINYNAI